MPLTRVPIHVSYVLYLASVSARAAHLYFANALRLCRLRGVEPSILLHPLDFLGAEDCPALAFFPGMDVALSAKLEIVGELFDILSARRELVTMGEHARRAGATDGPLPTLTPVFPN
jgi:hypothetical protein